jgi:hypothetical protein
MNNRDVEKINYNKLHNVYSSPYIIRMIKLGRMGETCNMHGYEKIMQNVSLKPCKKPEGKKPLNEGLSSNDDKECLRI